MTWAWLALPHPARDAADGWAWVLVPGADSSALTANALANFVSQTLQKVDADDAAQAAAGDRSSGDVTRRQVPFGRQLASTSGEGAFLAWNMPCLSAPGIEHVPFVAPATCLVTQLKGHGGGVGLPICFSAGGSFALCAACTIIQTALNVSVCPVLTPFASGTSSHDFCCS
jgi:hypothetical protein